MMMMMMMSPVLDFGTQDDEAIIPMQVAPV